MMLWANAYAAQNRVEPTGLDDVDYRLQTKDIPFSKYLPTLADRDILHTRMEVMVSHILVKHISHFEEHYKDVVTWHIPHTFAEESAKKGNLVSVLTYLPI